LNVERGLEMFTAEQLREMAIAVDQQLAAARVMPIADQRDAMDEVRQVRAQLRAQLVVQRQTIEVQTHEPADSFLHKFGQAARRDLCEEGSLLHDQWQKWGDLENEKTLGFVGGVLGMMGLTGGAVQAVAIAVTVIVLHLGVKTVCEEYGKE
jgi:hypothetical protein